MRGYVPLGKFAGAGTPFEWPQAIGHDRQPFASFPCGTGQLTAGPDGLALAIFGWVDPSTFEVSNAQMPEGLLGFVLPVIGAWRWDRAYRCKGLTILRPGLPCVLAIAGDFIARFPLGAQAGAQVWTDPATGLPYTADGGGFIATPWTAMQSGGPGARCRISSFARPVN